MTTMDAAAARRWHQRLALAVVMGLTGLGLAACETSTSLFGSNSTATPETAATTRPSPTQPPLAKVAVAPIIGAPDAIAKQIQQEFQSAVEKQRVSVVASKEERVDYTLRGYIVAAKEKTSIKVSYIWDVTDNREQKEQKEQSKRVHRITGEEVISAHASKDPWAAVTPQVAQSIAGKAASSFVSWLQSQSSQAAVASTSMAAKPAASVGAHPAPVAAGASPATAAAAAPPGRPAPTTASIGREGAVTAVVPSVTGAPGDGSASLTAAIQRELANKGVTVADKATAASYRVEGSVTLGEVKEGKQPIHIEWLVRDPKGKKLGTVSQRNEIPQGSLDGQWGKTAEQAAGAAAQGIVKLLPQPKAVN